VNAALLCTAIFGTLQTPAWNDVGGMFEGDIVSGGMERAVVQLDKQRGKIKQVSVRFYGLRPSSKPETRKQAARTIRQPGSPDRIAGLGDFEDRSAGFMDFRVQKVDRNGTLAVTVDYWVLSGINSREPGDIERISLTAVLVGEGLAKLDSQELSTLPTELQAELRRMQSYARHERKGMWK
jgi:hypothetical protein